MASINSLQETVHVRSFLYATLRMSGARLTGTPCDIARSGTAHARIVFDEPHWYMPSHKNRVLIVEDDPEIQAALEELMEGEGYDVTLAANGAEAIEML